MTGILEKIRGQQKRETLTEAWEVRAFRDEDEQQAPLEPSPPVPEAPHPDSGALQTAKGRTLGHGEQRIVPDDCQFGDNDLCNPES